MYTVFHNKVLTKNTTNLLWRTILGQSVELYNQLAIILAVSSPSLLRIHLQIHFIIYIFNAVCPRQIFTNIYSCFQNFHQRDQHQKMSLCYPLMYTLRQFRFQMEFCICQYNLFCLWHIAKWLWASICCYPLSSYPVLVCACWKVWVTEILYHHWRSSSWRRNNTQTTLQTACSSPAVFETYPSLRLAPCNPLQRAQTSS